MSISYCKEPKLDNPIMIASWPGIGNIGLMAVQTLVTQLHAEELGEIGPEDFFYPKKVIIRNGILQELEFPASKFYFKRLAKKDIVFFTGEEQPTDGGRAYAEGGKAYDMGNLVLDVAEKFGCTRVYTSGAAVSLTHHTFKPRVWAVTSSEQLNNELQRYENTVLMGEVEGRNEQGSITGLNGLLLGLAMHRGFEAVCVMGEIPDYLSGAPFPYPRASRSVLDFFTSRLELEIDTTSLDAMTSQIDTLIESIHDRLPPEIKERIEQRKSMVAQPKKESISEEDEKWLKEHIDELFKAGGKGEEKPS